ncbi:hypothetical protein KG892_02850 [Vermiphilus pyriformis]|nr:MAG: hypothetical protein KG892_02850 [Vermiphilus pyriformis]
MRSQLFLLYLLANTSHYIHAMQAEHLEYAFSRWDEQLHLAQTRLQSNLEKSLDTLLSIDGNNFASFQKDIIPLLKTIQRDINVTFKPFMQHIHVPKQHRDACTQVLNVISDRLTTCITHLARSTSTTSYNLPALHKYLIRSLFFIYHSFFTIVSEQQPGYFQNFTQLIHAARAIQNEIFPDNTTLKDALDTQMNDHESERIVACKIRQLTQVLQNTILSIEAYYFCTESNADEYTDPDIKLINSQLDTLKIFEQTFTGFYACPRTTHQVHEFLEQFAQGILFIQQRLSSVIEKKRLDLTNSLEFIESREKLSVSDALIVFANYRKNISKDTNTWLASTLNGFSIPALPTIPNPFQAVTEMGASVANQIGEPILEATSHILQTTHQLAAHISTIFKNLPDQLHHIDSIQEGNSISSKLSHYIINVVKKHLLAATNSTLSSTADIVMEFANTCTVLAETAERLKDYCHNTRLPEIAGLDKAIVNKCLAFVGLRHLEKITILSKEYNPFLSISTLYNYMLAQQKHGNNLPCIPASIINLMPSQFVSQYTKDLAPVLATWEQLYNDEKAVIVNNCKCISPDVLEHISSSLQDHENISRTMVENLYSFIWATRNHIAQEETGRYVTNTQNHWQSKLLENNEEIKKLKDSIKDLQNDHDLIKLSWKNLWLGGILKRYYINAQMDQLDKQLQGFESIGTTITNNLEIIAECAQSIAQKIKAAHFLLTTLKGNVACYNYLPNISAIIQTLTDKVDSSFSLYGAPFINQKYNNLSNSLIGSVYSQSGFDVDGDSSVALQ